MLSLRTRHLLVLLLLLTIPLLAACAAGSNAIVDTFKHVFPDNAAIDRLPLRHDIRYLRVMIDNRAVLLALGYVDADPIGPIEVWYSAEREVLRIQRGRIVGAVGITTEWRNVRSTEVPSWAEVEKSADPVTWTRSRDVMPGYRMGVIDKLSVQRSASQRGVLKGVDDKELSWFEEQQIAPLQVEDALPSAHFAVDLHGNPETVIYGQQCLSPKLCISWQRWSAANQIGSAH